ncbi:hypothetical protein CW304_23210 [Bacillus sp. UFRGS-B20]|nr:hypothetical protein CW304_23210 [Bacillus sp. UFRGS-B20]
MSNLLCISGNEFWGGNFEEIEIKTKIQHWKNINILCDLVGWTNVYELLSGEISLQNSIYCNNSQRNNNPNHRPMGKNCWVIGLSISIIQDIVVSSRVSNDGIRKENK